MDAQLMKAKDWGSRRWFINDQGQTFAVIEGPVEFRMGSLPNEPNREPDEVPNRWIIPRRFAVATKEVTVEQYQRYTEKTPIELKRSRSTALKTADHRLAPLGMMQWLTATG